MCLGESSGADVELPGPHGGGDDGAYGRTRSTTPSPSTHDLVFLAEESSPDEMLPRSTRFGETGAYFHNNTDSLRSNSSSNSSTSNSAGGSSAPTPRKRSSLAQSERRTELVATQQGGGRPGRQPPTPGRRADTQLVHIQDIDDDDVQVSFV